MSYVETLFFAFYLPAHAQEAAEAVTRAIVAREGWRGWAVSRDKLHVTAQFLAKEERMPDDILARAVAAGEALRHPAFRLSFDRLDTFPDTLGEVPVVLQCGGLDPIHLLNDALRRELKKVQFPLTLPTLYVPHLTLAYGNGTTRAPLPRPVAWSADAVALVLSRDRKHEIVGSWPLSGV